MRAYLVRVGIDQASGKWNAPIDPGTGDFVYVPIPEKAGTAFQPGMETDYSPFRSALDAFAALHPNGKPGICTPPEALNDLNPHLDPDFDRLTYGDNGLRRGKGLCDLAASDLVVFFAGMRPIQQSPHRLVYGIIGLYRVAEAVRLRDIPPSRWAENAHTRKMRHGPDDIIIRAQPGVSGRLKRSIPIGEFRDNAYLPEGVLKVSPSRQSTSSSPSLSGVRTPFGSLWPFRKVPFMVPISSATKNFPSLITSRAWRREMLRL